MRLGYLSYWTDDYWLKKKNTHFNNKSKLTCAIFLFAIFKHFLVLAIVGENVLSMGRLSLIFTYHAFYLCQTWSVFHVIWMLIHQDVVHFCIPVRVEPHHWRKQESLTYSFVFVTHCLRKYTYKYWWLLSSLLNIFQYICSQIFCRLLSNHMEHGHDY